LRKIHCEAAVADVTSELLAKQRLNIGFVVNDKNKQSHLSATALLEFGEFAGPGINLDRPGVPLDDNVVAQRETKAGSFARVVALSTAGPPPAPTVDLNQRRLA
jgi:hypothetical protein